MSWRASMAEGADVVLPGATKESLKSLSEFKYNN
jgi:hypothetical protein